MNGDSICRTLSDFLNRGESFDRLLEETVRILHESNPQFDWTGIYELMPENVLRLGPFVGAATEHLLIPVGQGVCGSAVSEAHNKIVPDVTQEPNYLACSLETKSEAVVLIKKGRTIFGQIDIDSHTFDAFDETTVQQLQKVADWLANVYANRDPQTRE